MGTWASKKTMEDNPYGRRLRKGWQSVVITDVRKQYMKDTEGHPTKNGWVIISLENEWEEKADVFLSDDPRDYPKIRALMDIYAALDFPDGSSFDEVFDIFKNILLTEKREVIDVEVEYSKGDRIFLKKIMAEGTGGDEEEEEEEQGTDKPIGEYEIPEESREPKRDATESKDNDSGTKKKGSIREKSGKF